MASVDIESLETGMVLKADVRDPLGRLLVAGGTVVSDRHAQVLRKWGIRVVDVVGDENASESVISEEHRTEAERIVEGRFRHVDLSNPFVVELHHQVVERTARLLAAEEDCGA